MKQIVFAFLVETVRTHQRDILSIVKVVIIYLIKYVSVRHDLFIIEYILDEYRYDTGYYNHVVEYILSTINVIFHRMFYLFPN